MMYYRACRVLCACLFIVFGIAVAEADVYTLNETGRFDIPQCSDTSGFICSDTLRLYMFHGENGLVLNHQRGYSFIDDYVSPPRMGQEYATFCSTLSPVGEDKNGNILFTHANTPDCTCSNAVDEPCIPQPLVVSPPALSGFLQAEEGIGSRRLASISSDFNASAVFVRDTTGGSYACGTITNAESIANNIAVILQGNCSFDQKVAVAQNAGAVACIVVSSSDELFPMELNGTTIPAILISNDDGVKINNLISLGTPVIIQLGAHTGNLSVAGNASVGLLWFPPSVFYSTGPTSGNSNTDVFQYVDGSALDVARGHLWISDPNDTDGLIQIFDVNDLNSPVLLRSYTSSNFALAQTLIDNDITFGYFTAVGGKYYFVQPLYNLGQLIVLDVTNISDITVVQIYGKIMTSEAVAIRGGAPEIIVAAGANLTIVDSVHFFNISLPVQTAIASTQVPPETHIGTAVIDVAAVGSHLFVSYGSDGVFLYDIDDILAPSLLAYTKTVAAEGSYSVGALQVYPYNQSSVLVLNYDPPNYSLLTYTVYETSTTSSTSAASSSTTSTTTTLSTTSTTTSPPTLSSSLSTTTTTTTTTVSTSSSSLGSHSYSPPSRFLLLVVILAFLLLLS